MDVLLRTIAVIIEVLIIGAVFFCILLGVRMLLLDAGLTPRYSRIITVALLAVGALLGTFLVSHLVTFYPPV